MQNVVPLPLPEGPKHRSLSRARLCRASLRSSERGADATRKAPTESIFVRITLLPPASAVHSKQSCAVSSALPLKTRYFFPGLSLPCLLMQPPPPFLFLAGALFIMLLLNILQPIAPKELVCYNMKIWPHLAKVTGNKHLTRGWADGASNSNLLPAPCWFAVLAGVISLPPPSGQPAPEECRAFYFHASALLPSRASDLLILTFSWN